MKNKPESSSDPSSQVPLSLEVKSAVNPQPRPRRHHLVNEDKSIMEMQMTYPDLAIRGRPLLQHNTHQASSSRSSNNAAYIDKDTDDIKAGNLSNNTKSSKAANRGKSDHRKPGEVLGEDGRNSSSACSRGAGCNESASDGTSNHGDNSNANNASISSSDGGRAVDERRGPQAISLHITLRAGTKSEPCVRPGDAQPTESPTWTERQAAAGKISSTA